MGCRWLIGITLACPWQMGNGWANRAKGTVPLAPLFHDGSDTCINCAMFGGSSQWCLGSASLMLTSMGDIMPESWQADERGSRGARGLRHSGA